MLHICSSTSALMRYHVDRIRYVYKSSKSTRFYGAYVAVLLVAVVVAVVAAIAVCEDILKFHFTFSYTSGEVSKTAFDAAAEVAMKPRHDNLRISNVWLRAQNQ
uniref:Uncharacterized protein n=2 Tax=Lygus hesperus TaxID=30085 RepID=A0A146LI64_LYGHE